jgi:DNA-binding transcriptional ArsR family regulator
LYLTITLINQLAKYMDGLNETFAALADPTRRAIVMRLAEGEATVNELAAPFDISLPAISRHLKVLEAAGLITRTRSAQLRPCRIETGPLKEIADWVDRYRGFWDQSFDRLDIFLSAAKGKDDENAGR